MIYVGIDPGQKGGVSFVSSKTNYVTIPMPSAFELNDILLNWNKDFSIKHCFLERAQSMPKQGVKSMFNYGDHYGQIQGILISQSISFTLVPPKDWQKEMLKGSCQKKTTKERALEIARRLFPKEKFVPTIRSTRPHDGMIDSILLAEFCRRKIL